MASTGLPGPADPTTGDTMNDTPERCDEVRHQGGWELFCEHDAGHEGWHQASITESRIVGTDGFRSEVTSTETHSWEPQHIKRVLRPLSRRIEERQAVVPVAAGGGDTGRHDG